jgi:integrase
MAQIQQRGKNNAFQFTVNQGRDVNGKKVRQTMTWIPPKNMTARQIEKEVQRQAVLFEEQCKGGKINTAVKFEEYANQWFTEVAVLYLKTGTQANYKCCFKRIYKSIGFMRMDKITSRDIQRFILDLCDCYELSPKSVRNYVALVSTVFEHAVKMQIISNNPCRAVTLPKLKERKQEIYSIEETQRILELLHQEDENKYFDFMLYFTLSIFTGFRRGELLGLEFLDFGYERSTVTINRTSLYSPDIGVYTDIPKTKMSFRTLKLPAEIMSLLSRYKAHKQEQAKSVGNKWNNQIEGMDGKLIDNDRLFTTWDGSPMFITSPSWFFQCFCERHEIRYLTGHSLRHLHASIEINAGTDVKTLQVIMGHSTANTTLGIYCHAFSAAQAAAMDRFSSVIPFPTAKSQNLEIGHQTDIKIVKTSKNKTCESAL